MTESSRDEKGSVLSIDKFEYTPCRRGQKTRVQYEMAIYHIMNRGDHREDIFLDNEDRELFLETLGQACAKTDWQIHAWCLMRNHLRLVVETHLANLMD